VSFEQELTMDWQVHLTRRLDIGGPGGVGG